MSPSTSSDAREYAAHRAAIIALLRKRFGAALNESDREDLYHEAWAGVLEHRRRGGRTPDLLGLLKTIAWRRARDRVRNLAADPADPRDGALARALDGDPPPDEQAEVHAEAELCRQLIDSLGGRQRQILKLRYEWQLSPREIQAALGLSRKVYERQLTRAVKRVAAAAGEVERGGWRRRQVDLLMRCEDGSASAEELAHARSLVARDPVCRALLRRLRGAAALVPAPLVIGGEPVGRGPLDSLRHLWRTVSARGGDVLRHPGAAEAAAGGGAATVGGAGLVKLAVVAAGAAATVGGVVIGAPAAKPRSRVVASRFHAVATRAATPPRAARRAPTQIRRSESRRRLHVVRVDIAAVPVRAAHPPAALVHSTRTRPRPPARAAVPSGNGDGEFGP